ncbi:glycosyltransferase family 4 protein [Jatrophihabitans telluris]|uniref:Glycosyltransferase family 4 protein n=1 Tax=Jatrophihabitans telluris TaxID=2038343 RepID=A0ABY4QZ13_9ACTN|nr:glycosyltransferase family 4 protein [Jatrophihabitans telluris]UQX88447.1 glycosyltransferase family 4 protein [Jatrophihabitans telluris]
MRIAHVTDCYLPRLGGIERQVHGLATAQQAQGHDVEVITSVPAGLAGDQDSFPVHRPASRRLSESGIAPIRYGSSWSGTRTVRRGRYDVVHVHASTFSPLPYLTARAVAGRVPVALTLHSMWAWAAPIFRGADWVLGWRDWPIAWSAVSRIAAEELSSELLGRSVAVLPNAVDTVQWAPPAESPRPPSRVRIATTMRLAARKRPLELLQMMRAVRAGVPDSIRIDLDIIGDGPLAPQLRHFLAVNGMTGWVHLLGQLPAEEILARYADTDVYLSPATLESFGIAALEARSAGLPVVAFASTGTADFVRDGHEGLLARDDGGMVEAIRRLVISPDLRHRLTAHNRSVRPVQTWPLITAAAEQLYESADTTLRRNALVAALR